MSKIYLKRVNNNNNKCWGCYFCDLKRGCFSIVPCFDDKKVYKKIPEVEVKKILSRKIIYG